MPFIPVQAGGSLQAIEAKSAATIIPRFLQPLQRLAEQLDLPEGSTRLVYGGNRRLQRSGVTCMPWYTPVD